MSKKHKQLRVNYRSIWKAYHGAIPKDDHGMNYHIHHIDGDPTNNDITNLQAVSAEEHYKIHAHEFVKWASLAHIYLTEEGREKLRLSGIKSGTTNYKNKLGIFNPETRKNIDELNSKKWRIVSPSRGIDITILSLNKWCNENNISRSAMNCAYLNNRPYDDYYILQIDKYETIETKYVTRIHKNSKKHILLNEDGTLFEVTNLSKWCKDNGISREGLKSASYKGKFYKGFSLPYLTNHN